MYRLCSNGTGVLGSLRGLIYELPWVNPTLVSIDTQTQPAFKPSQSTIAFNSKPIIAVAGVQSIDMAIIPSSNRGKSQGLI